MKVKLVNLFKKKGGGVSLEEGEEKKIPLILFKPQKSGDPPFLGDVINWQEAVQDKDTAHA